MFYAEKVRSGFSIATHCIHSIQWCFFLPHSFLDCSIFYSLGGLSIAILFSGSPYCLLDSLRQFFWYTFIYIWCFLCLALFSLSKCYQTMNATDLDTFCSLNNLPNGVLLSRWISIQNSIRYTVRSHCDDEDDISIYLYTRICTLIHADFIPFQSHKNSCMRKHAS